MISARRPIMLSAFAAGMLVVGAASWGIIYEGEDSVIGPNSFEDYRPGANWSNDMVVYLWENWPDGYAAFEPGEGTFEVGVRVRAGYGPSYPDAFVDYTGVYKGWINGTYELTLAADWDTFEYYGDADNHVWMYPTGPVTFGAGDLFVVTSNWKYSMVDAFWQAYEPQFCGDLDTVYLPEDLNTDCYVNWADFSDFAGQWLDCTDPADPNCGDNWPVVLEAEDGRVKDGAWTDSRPPHASGPNNEVVFLNSDPNSGYVMVFPGVNQGNYMFRVRVRAGYGGDAGLIINDGPNSQTGLYHVYRDNYEITCLPDWSSFEYFSDTDNYVWLEPTGVVSITPYSNLLVRSDWAWGFVDVLEVQTNPQTCGEPGTLYEPGDLDKDCYVNWADFSIFAGAWLNCTDPAEPNCDQYWK